MVEQKELPVSSDKGEESYIAVPSQTQAEANGKPWNASKQFGPLSPVARDGGGEGG